MPELPEMENYRIQLSHHILDQPITNVNIHRDKSINLPPDQFVEGLLGRQVIFIERRAKYLLFHLDNGRRLVLHLMLGGLLYLGSTDDRPERNTQIEISFGDNRVLYFIGLRLGYLHFLSAKEVDEELSHLGVEPLGRKMNVARFVTLLKGRRGTLKTTLINQGIFAGIGNCYADEIAYEAKLMPSVKIQALQEEDFSALYLAMRDVLSRAIEAGGYIELPLFKDDSLTGGANDLCKVYDREGETCHRCGDQIVKAELSGRKVFYSPGCQHDR